uniref:TLC domain-containing protein n=1 Tax=Eimeria tenella TaxID=5802 RepID=H9BA36_EIMTE|nr:hypothetical protein [Eimeria tenella]
MVRLDRVFGILLAVIAGWSAFHYPKVAGSIRHRLSVPGGGYPDPSDLRIYGSAAAVIYLLFQGLCTWILKPLADRLLPRDRWSEQVRQLLCSHFGEMTWKMLYFLMTTAVCLLSFRNERWWPQQLGGEGAEEQLWQGYPMQQNSVYCHLYFYVAFGHHLASLIYILKSPWLPDFFDRLLPCAAALCLIYFSYISNFLRVGVVILFCHDISDIFTCGCKAFVDTPYHKVTIGLFVLLTVCWFYFRLYTFPSAALFPIYKAIKTRPDHSETEGSSYFIFILLTLSLMNIYWFVLMVKMFVHFILSGQMRDLHSRVSEEVSSAQSRSREISSKASKAE